MKKYLQNFRLRLLAVLVLMTFAMLVSGQTVLFTETWETATIGQTPPAGWAVDLVAGTHYTHFLYAGTVPTCTPYSGNRMVEFKSATSAAGTKNRLRRSVPVSTSGQVFVSVDFRWFTSNNYPFNQDNVEVQWSLDGTGWNTAGTVQRYENNNGWKYKEVALPAGAANQPVLYIALLFTSEHGHNCHLDLVHVNGYTTIPQAPTVTTLAPAWVGAWTAYLAGNVNANGFQATTYFEYGLTPAYGSTYSSEMAYGNTATSVNAYPYPLNPSHTYHCRVVATNLGGTTYGNDVTFTTLDTIPQVFTDQPTNVTQSSATLNGMVYPGGSPTTVTFNYGLTPAYGTTVSATPSVVSGDSLQSAASANLTGLTPMTTYHYQIKGVSSAGTSYGIDTVFTTTGSLPATVITGSASSITSASATLHGQVNANGTPTEVHFQYGLTTAYGSTTYAGSVNGTTLTAMSSNISGLTPGTTYHYRAKGVNANGTTYGNDSVFTTSVVLPPSVTTNPALAVGAKFAILSGTFNANGNQTETSFQYGYTTSYGMTVQSGNITGNTPATLQPTVYGLTPGHLYHYRAKGSSAGGTVYGADMTFTTADTLPEVFTYHASNVGQTNATLNGRVYPNGLSTAITFDYGLTSSYGTTVNANPATITGDSLSTWADAMLTGLSPNTTYHYRIKGVNAIGITYGMDTVFTTSSTAYSPPTVITTGAYFITATNAGFSGTVNPNGSATTVSFQYGLTPAYGHQVQSGTFNGNTWTTVYDQAFNLQPSTLYHFRIVGTNAGGTSYGQDTTFITTDSSSCDAIIAYENAGSLAIQFHDASTGGDHTRYWQFGDGTMSQDPNPLHVYPAPGIYNVFLRITGSSSSFCYDSTYQVVEVSDSTPPCHAQYTWTADPVDPNTIHFTNTSTGNYIDRIWHFEPGHTSSAANPSYTFPGQGTYNVCLNIYGPSCTDSSCQDITIAAGPGHHLYGQVFASGSPIETGVVNLFAVDTIPPYAPYMDISSIDSSGTYNFYSVPDGDYYINAIPAGLPGYLPTYYGDVIFWEDATVIHLGAAQNPYDIHLDNAVPLSPGNGSIGGQISITGLKTTYFDKISMMLMNSNGHPVTYNQVSTGGHFSFAGLAYGTYYLKAEMAGVVSELIKVVLSADNPAQVVSMSFNGNSITGVSGPGEEVVSWMIFPNPVTDQVHLTIVTLKQSRVEAKILNFDGKVVSSSSFGLGTGSNRLTMSATMLPAGVYILRLRSVDGLIFNTKLVKR